MIGVGRTRFVVKKYLGFVKKKKYGKFLVYYDFGHLSDQDLELAFSSL